MESRIEICDTKEKVWHSKSLKCIGNIVHILSLLELRFSRIFENYSPCFERIAQLKGNVILKQVHACHVFIMQSTTRIDFYIINFTIIHACHITFDFQQSYVAHVSYMMLQITTSPSFVVHKLGSHCNFRPSLIHRYVNSLKSFWHRPNNYHYIPSIASPYNISRHNIDH